MTATKIPPHKINNISLVLTDAPDSDTQCYCKVIIDPPVIDDALLQNNTQPSFQLACVLLGLIQSGAVQNSDATHLPVVETLQ